MDRDGGVGSLPSGSDGEPLRKWAAYVAPHPTHLGYADRLAAGRSIGRGQVLRADAYRWAERWVPPAGQPVNLYLSPPFPDLQGVKVFEFAKMVAQLLAKAPDDSVLVLQVEDGFPLDDLPDPALWDVRRYGRNRLLFRVKETTVVETPPAESPPVQS